MWGAGPGATAFALAVTHPQAGNIGGGGFLVVVSPGGRAASFDFREKAPLAAREDMFLDENGKYDRDRHHWSHLAVGVPGSVAGLWQAHRRLGKLPWRRLVEPAVTLAREGFPVSDGFAATLEVMLPKFAKYPAALAQFSKEGQAYEVGEIFRQTDLATTLARIRDRGPAGFYTGETAALIAAEMKRGGGLITTEDLRRYRPVERAPIRGTYRGFDIVGMPPPSSGGIAVVEMLNILEGYDLAKIERRSSAQVHLLAETMRRAFADRARNVADADFVEVPVDRLTSKAHAMKRRASIDEGRASRSSPESFEWSRESDETTHLSVVDKDRMAVSLTTTLEQSFGSYIVVPGAGFLLNNEMGDFNPERGVTKTTGQIGTKPNLVEPEKRMLSSMSPTIVLRDGRPVLVVGSPGGRTIINTVLGIVVDHLDYGLPIQKAVDAPRLHHQWLPDRLVYERGALSVDTENQLRELGHTLLTRHGPQGSAMAIAILQDGRLETGCDPRRPDAAAAGH